MEVSGLPKVAFRHSRACSVTDGASPQPRTGQTVGGGAKAGGSGVQSGRLNSNTFSTKVQQFDFDLDFDLAILFNRCIKNLLFHFRTVA